MEKPKPIFTVIVTDVSGFVHVFTFTDALNAYKFSSFKREEGYNCSMIHITRPDSYKDHWGKG